MVLWEQNKEGTASPRGIVSHSFPKIHGFKVWTQRKNCEHVSQKPVFAIVRVGGGHNKESDPEDGDDFINWSKI